MVKKSSKFRGVTNTEALFCCFFSYLGDQSKNVLKINNDRVSRQD